MAVFCYLIFGNCRDIMCLLVRELNGALNYMNMTFFWGALAIMLIIIARDFLKKRYGFDMDKFDVAKYFPNRKNKSVQTNKSVVITRTSGKNKLIMLDAGVNKATVMATLRQITGLDYKSAKTIVDSVPYEFMVNISDKEADLTKKALEFVGAKIEIK